MEEQSMLLGNLTYTLSFLSLVGIVFVVLYAVLLIYSFYTKRHFAIFDAISGCVLPLGFFVSLAGTSLSLVYSMGFGMVPCELCWVQRIFLYPLVFMFAYAWWKKDRAVLPYAFILSVIGFVIAFYHHALQMGYNVYKPCSAAPFAADCSKPSFIEFGFVSFPFMALVLFSFVIVVVLSSWISKKEKGVDNHGK